MIDPKEIKVGKWYMLNFRAEKFKAKVVEINNEDITVIYYNHMPWRTRDVFTSNYFLYEVKKPSLFRNL